MDVRDNRILAFTIYNFPVIARFIQKNAVDAHLLPEADAFLYFLLVQTLAIAQANVAEEFRSRATLCKVLDDPARLLVFVRTHSWRLAVRAMIRKLDSVAEHNHVVRTENASSLLDVTRGPICDAGISIVDCQAFWYVRTKLRLRKNKAQPSEYRH